LPINEEMGRQTNGQYYAWHNFAMLKRNNTIFRTAENKKTFSIDF